jgi:hypothetical protein
MPFAEGVLAGDAAAWVVLGLKVCRQQQQQQQGQGQHSLRGVDNWVWLAVLLWGQQGICTQ